MRTRVKVCGMTRIEDARAAVRMGVDYLGVIFYPKSPRRVAPEKLEDLLFAIPDGKRVMVDVQPTAETLRKRVDLGFDYCQVHFEASTISRAEVEAWNKAVGHCRLWLAPRVKPGEALPDFLFEFADVLLLDSYKADRFGGTGETGAWDTFAQLAAARPDKRFILAGGLGPDNIAAALAATHAAAVDLNSGVESAPGIKDLKKLAATLEIVRRQA